MKLHRLLRDPNLVLIPKFPDRWSTTGASTTSALAGQHRAGYRRPNGFPD